MKRQWILAGVLATGLLLVLALVLGIRLGASQVQAQGPGPMSEVSALNVNVVDDNINVQGRLTSGGSPVNGSVDVTFRLYGVSTGGTALWSEVQSVTASNGYFSVELDVDQDLFNGQALWLGMQVSGDSEMTPRQKILPVPYALGLVPGALTYGSDLSSTLTISNTGDWYDPVLRSTEPIVSDDRVDYLQGVRVHASGIYTWIRDWVGYTSTERIDLGVGVHAYGRVAGIYGSSDQLNSYGGYFVNDSGYGVYGTGNVGVAGVVGYNKSGVAGSSTSLPGGYGCPGVGVCGRGDKVGVRGESFRFGSAVYAINNSDVITHPTLKVVNRWIGGGGDLIRGYGSPDGPVEESDLVFRVTAAGDLSIDGNYLTPASDFAEMMSVEGDAGGYEPGDVLVISDDEDRAVELSTEAYSSAVIGIYSTRPGFVGGADNVDGVPVAVVGIVPCKVSAENGPIQRGDLLTTSNTPGHAMKVTDRTLAVGAILGKALAPLESGTGVISVLVTLQ